MKPNLDYMSFYRDKLKPVDKIGYKWIRDNSFDIFIVELNVLNEAQAHPERFPLEWCTTDCIVRSIRRFRDGRNAEGPFPGAYYTFNYSVGQHITGTLIYYCQSMDELMKSERGAIKYCLIKHEKEPYWRRFHRHNIPVFEAPFGEYYHYLVDVMPRKGRLPIL